MEQYNNIVKLKEMECEDENGLNSIKLSVVRCCGFCEYIFGSITGGEFLG
jgi:hypothetical protein